LRLIDYQIKGFRPSQLVTNVLDPQQLSREEMVEMQPGLYHQRWQIETTFAEMKVQQGMEENLRGRTPEAIRYEVAGHVLLYLLVRWLMVEAATAHDLADPLRISFQGALRELSQMSQTLLLASPQRVATVLLPRLLKRIASHQVPWRPGRRYPRPHDTKIRRNGKGKVSLPSKLQPHEQ
jgi:hypothetical protein